MGNSCMKEKGGDRSQLSRNVCVYLKTGGGGERERQKGFIWRKKGEAMTWGERKPIKAIWGGSQGPVMYVPNI